ncbi:MAG: hypothetical protein V1738_06390 [Patescibacteria group bacterium]
MTERAYVAVPARGNLGQRIAAGDRSGISVAGVSRTMLKDKIHDVIQGQIVDFKLAEREYGADARYDYYIVRYDLRHRFPYKADLSGGVPVARVPASALSVEDALSEMEIIANN